MQIIDIDDTSDSDENDIDWFDQLVRLSLEDNNCLSYTNYASSPYRTVPFKCTDFNIRAIAIETIIYICGDAGDNDDNEQRQSNE